MQAFADQQSKLQRQSLPGHLFSVHQRPAYLVTNLQELDFCWSKKTGIAMRTRAMIL